MKKAISSKKKNISGQKDTSNLTKVLLDEKQFLQKAITAKNPFLAKKFDQV